MLIYDESEILARLETLVPTYRAAFALGLAERWLPAYVVFSQREARGDASAIRLTLESSWVSLAHREERPIDPTPVHEQLQIAVACEGMVAEAAQAAAYCAAYAVRATNDQKNCRHAMYAARSVRTGIDALLGYLLGTEALQEPTSVMARKETLAELDQAILAHPRMQVELEIIYSSLSELASIPSGNDQISRCRERWARSWPSLL